MHVEQIDGSDEENYLQVENGSAFSKREEKIFSVGTIKRIFGNFGKTVTDRFYLPSGRLGVCFLSILTPFVS